MSSVLVTVQGPNQRVELQLPAHRPIGELLSMLVDVCCVGYPIENTRWELAPLGGLAFDSSRTLSEVGVIDGSLLHMRDTAAPVRNLNYLAGDRPPDEPLNPGELDVMLASGWEDSLLPQDRTRLVLPAWVPLPGRAMIALRAALQRSAGDSWAPVTEPQPGQIVDPGSMTVRSGSRMADRVRVSWRSTDYCQRLDDAIVAPQLGRCVTIAVMSPKGGVGKTTTAILLGSLFALLRRDRVVAVDTNPDFGSLGRQLAPEHAVFVDDLHEVLDDPQLTVTALDNHLGRAAHGLMVLPAPTDPVRADRLGVEAYTNVVRKLQQMVGVIVLDTGTGFHGPAARAALSAADQVVLVSDYELATASLVAEAATLLKQDKPLWLVMNRSVSPTELDLRSFGAIVPFARGLVEIGSDVRAARLVAAGRFNWPDAPRRWRLSVRELAASLVAEWPELGICA